MIYCNTKNRIGRRTAQREIREYQADADAPIVKSSSTHNEGSDVGILSVVNDEHQDSYGALFEGSRLLAPSPKILGCDSSNVVACVDGYTEDGSCADACIDVDTDVSGCCSGIDSCTNFTGLICRDVLSPSCSGTEACKDATIGWSSNLV